MISFDVIIKYKNNRNINVKTVLCRDFLSAIQVAEMFIDDRKIKIEDIYIVNISKSNANIINYDTIIDIKDKIALLKNILTNEAINESIKEII